MKMITWTNFLCTSSILPIRLECMNFSPSFPILLHSSLAYTYLDTIQNLHDLQWNEENLKNFENILRNQSYNPKFALEYDSFLVYIDLLRGDMNKGGGGAKNAYITRVYESTNWCCNWNIYWLNDRRWKLKVIINWNFEFQQNWSNVLIWAKMSQNVDPISHFLIQRKNSSKQNFSVILSGGKLN